MGIRYYGWANHADEVAEAVDDPWLVVENAEARWDVDGLDQPTT